MRSLVSQLSPALLACVALLMVGCGKSSGGARLGGESHFLGNCTQGCGALSCIAGVCTLPCAEASACGDLNAQAVCRIEAGESAGFCDLACSGEAACPGGSELSCQAGYCRSDASAGPGSLVSSSNLTSDAGASAPVRLACAANTTLTGDVNIRSQDELETLEGCEEIAGNLDIGEVSDLRPLHSLERVGGRLSLTARSALSDGVALDPLAQLESLGGFAVTGFVLTGVPDLPRLRHLGALELTSTTLTDLSAFRNATGITTLRLEQTTLRTLDGLTNVDALREIELGFNEQLTDLGALSSLVSLDKLSIRGMELENLDFLPQMRAIGELLLQQAVRLQNIDALANIESLGSITIYNCNSLTHLPEFPRITELAALIVDSNSLLQMGNSFPALRHLTASGFRDGYAQGLTLIGNEGLGVVEFPQLESVGQVLLSGNAGLIELRLPLLRESSFVAVDNNPQLSELRLPALVPNGSVYIERNEQLSSIQLPQLATETAKLDQLVIALNPALETAAIQVAQTQDWKVSRVAANAGIAQTGTDLRGQQLEPCPWEGDGYCDACAGPGGERSWGVVDCRAQLCAFGTDTADCSPTADAGP